MHLPEWKSLSSLLAGHRHASVLTKDPSSTFKSPSEKAPPAEELELRQRYDQAQSALISTVQALPDEQAFLREAVRVMFEAAAPDRLGVLLHDAARQAYTHLAGLPADEAAHQQDVPENAFSALAKLAGSLRGLHVHRSAAVLPDASAVLDWCKCDEVICIPFFENRQQAGFVTFACSTAAPQRWTALEYGLIENLVKQFEMLRAWIRTESRYRQVVAAIHDCLAEIAGRPEPEPVRAASAPETEPPVLTRSVLLSTMSHEVRTPLGAISGFAELLAQELREMEQRLGKPMPAQVTEFVAAIRENARKLLGLVNDLFDLSNLEAGAAPVRLVPVPLDDIINRVTSHFAPQLSEKGVDFQVQLEAAGLVALGDPQRIEQVLATLLSNAAKFTEHGSVTVRAHEQGAHVVIEVSDTGIGISEAYLHQLFTPFSQEDSRLNRRFEGTGLGLALVKRFVDLMKGRLEVDSTKGQGSCFRVILPSANPDT